MPPKKEARCGSVDRVLESSKKKNTRSIDVRDTEGSSNYLPSGRKTKSVDDLLEEKSSNSQNDDIRRPSNHFNNNNNDCEMDSCSGKSKSSSPIEQLYETEAIVVDNTFRKSEDRDSNLNNNTSEPNDRDFREGSVLSIDDSMSSVSDQNNEKRRNKFLSKYVNKMKSYLKK